MIMKSIKIILTLVSLAAPFVGCNLNEYDASEVIDKTPEQLLQLRGYESETHFARTKDGYHIHVVRIINPLIRSSGRPLRRPVIFNHGLLESSTIWLVNSRGVSPQDNQCSAAASEPVASVVAAGAAAADLAPPAEFINAPMMLANHGHDVWLMSMRGTDMSQKHDNLSALDEQFWNYCLDDFALSDVPTVINYVLEKTGAPKVAYVGHSQATFSVFALLSIRPSYADVIEPVVAVAPVAYMDHTTSVARLLFVASFGATSLSHHAPFPREARKMRKLISTFCGIRHRPVSNTACQLMDLLVSGRGRKTFLKGYWAHLPFYTSLKVLRQFGQIIKSKRFSMYDYGTQTNARLYGSERAPSYPISKIRSKSLCLINTKSDKLSPPEDVNHFVSELRIPPFKSIFIDKDFNHLDMITDRQAGQLVNLPLLKLMQHFERKSNTCNKQPSSHSSKTNRNLFEQLFVVPQQSIDASSDEAGWLEQALRSGGDHNPLDPPLELTQDDSDRF